MGYTFVQSFVMLRLANMQRSFYMQCFDYRIYWLDELREAKALQLTHSAARSSPD